MDKYEIFVFTKSSKKEPADSKLKILDIREKESVKKMKHSECISTGGLIYYTEKQANNAHQLLINESRPSSEKNGN